jgi:hypothetical protein
MLIEIEIDETNLILGGEQVLILSNFNYKKGEMSLMLQKPGFHPTPEATFDPVNIIFGSTHNEITKKRTWRAKAIKKAIMERNNTLAQVAKGTKQFKKDNPETKEEK